MPEGDVICKKQAGFNLQNVLQQVVRFTYPGSNGIVIFCNKKIAIAKKCIFLQ